MNTTARQLALALITEIIAQKRALGIVPGYALHAEVQAKLSEVLDALIADSLLIGRLAGVNRRQAYELPQPKTTTTPKA